MRVRVAFGILAAAILAVGCAELLGLDGLKDRVDGGSDGGSDALGEGSVPEASACALKHPPLPPAQDDPSDASVELFNVVREIKFAGPDAAATYGYDIDDIDTCCLNAPESCVPPVVANKHCDEEGGVDNRGGESLQSILSVGIGGLNQESLNDALDGGAFSLGIAVEAYNGQPNDTQVVVAAFVSSGTVDADGGYLHQAKWDGNDVWSIEQASTPGGTDDAGIPYPFNFDAKAYVTNGTVVAHMTFPFVIGSGTGTGAVTTLTNAVMSGQLVPDNGSFRIDNAQLSGRVRLTDLFSMMHGLPNPFAPGTFMCPGTNAYDYAKPLVCELADINADPSLDSTGAPCDAISFSAGFTMYRAQPGLVVNPGNSPSPCLDASAEQCP